MTNILDIAKKENDWSKASEKSIKELYDHIVKLPKNFKQVSFLTKLTFMVIYCNQINSNHYYIYLKSNSLR